MFSPRAKLEFYVRPCFKNNWTSGDFLGSSVVKTPSFHWRGMGLIPGLGTKIPHATWCGKKKKKKVLKKSKNNLTPFSLIISWVPPDSKSSSSFKFSWLGSTIPHHACWQGPQLVIVLTSSGRWFCKTEDWVKAMGTVLRHVPNTGGPRTCSFESVGKSN